LIAFPALTGHVPLGRSNGYARWCAPRVRRSLALTDRSKRRLSVVTWLHPGRREGPLMTHRFFSGSVA
jgi:hypothetical protein